MIHFFFPLAILLVLLDQRLQFTAGPSPYGARPPEFSVWPP